MSHNVVVVVVVVAVAAAVVVMVVGVVVVVVVTILFVAYSVTNLKYWTSSKLVVSKTLQLLNDLSLGYVN